MTAKTPAPEAECLAVTAGCSSLRWLEAGTTLIVLDGCMTLEYPPRWLADGQTLRIRHALGAGHAHVVETSGWWALYADQGSSAHLRVVSPAAPVRRRSWPAIWQWLVGWTLPRQTSRG